MGCGLGFWGDMVVTLRSGDKVELRSLPQCAPPLPRWVGLGFYRVCEG